MQGCKARILSPVRLPFRHAPRRAKPILPPRQAAKDKAEKLFRPSAAAGFCYAGPRPPGKAAATGENGHGCFSPVQSKSGCFSGPSRWGWCSLSSPPSLATWEQGLPYNLSPRDAPAPSVGKVTGRLSARLHQSAGDISLLRRRRARRQHRGQGDDTSALGAQIYFWARVVYVPVYGAGIPARPHPGMDGVRHRPGNGAARGGELERLTACPFSAGPCGRHSGRRGRPSVRPEAASSFAVPLPSGVRR